jgi:hypothetical protein
VSVACCIFCKLYWHIYFHFILPGFGAEMFGEISHPNLEVALKCLLRFLVLLKSLFCKVNFKPQPQRYEQSTQKIDVMPWVSWLTGQQTRMAHASPRCSISSHLFSKQHVTLVRTCCSFAVIPTRESSLASTILHATHVTDAHAEWGCG